jgi:pyrrolidone-carboxylate peptidase
VANGTDEFGIAKANEAIAAGKPAQARSRIAFQLRSDMEYAVPILISGNAGEFLCNYALYQYNQLDAQVSGFIHVPPQENVPDEAYLKAIRPVVMDILKQNLVMGR